MGSLIIHMKTGQLVHWNLHYACMQPCTDLIFLESLLALHKSKTAQAMKGQDARACLVLAYITS